MKYHITITRTYTYETDIEAQNECDANNITEELEAVLDDHDFELETTWDISRVADLIPGTPTGISETDVALWRDFNLEEVK